MPPAQQHAKSAETTCNLLNAQDLTDATGTGKVAKVKKGTWLDQTKARQELGRKPLSAHQQRQLAHTAAGRLHGNVAAQNC